MCCLANHDEFQAARLTNKTRSTPIPVRRGNPLRAAVLDYWLLAAMALLAILGIAVWKLILS